MLEQRRLALQERITRITTSAYKFKWIHLDGGSNQFNIGIQVHDKQDIANLQILDLSKTLDDYDVHSVQSDTELIEICDRLYEVIARHYTKHDVHIEVVNFNQTVLSTTYFNK